MHVIAIIQQTAKTMSLKHKTNLLKSQKSKNSQKKKKFKKKVK